MSLPRNRLAVVASPGELFSPDDLGRPNRTIDYERGGVGVSDGSQGFDVRDWRARLVGNNVVIGYMPDGPETTLFSDTGITQITLTFDQNMRPSIGYVAFGIGKLWWYDSAIPGQTTTVIGPGVKSPFLTLDDKREGMSAVNDMLLFYFIGSRLCYRQQRERFNTERTLRWMSGTRLSIAKVGMNKSLRLQIEIAGKDNSSDPYAYLPAWSPASYITSGTSITATLPQSVAVGDVVMVAIVARSAITAPAGWTLHTSADCASAATALQRLSVFTKDTVAPADANTTAVFTQAAAGRMGVMSVGARRDGGAVSILSAGTAAVNSTSTNAVTPAVATSTANGQLAVVFATTINAQATTTTPTPPTDFDLISGAAADTRLACAYLAIDNTAATSGSMAFDNGSPTNNGLAAITLRFGPT